MKRRETSEHPYTICIYVKDMAGGFRYTVGAIVANGYRRVDERGQLVWFPPHMIYSVKAKGPGLETQYPDEVFRT